MSEAHMTEPSFDASETAISRAIGEELRRAREAQGWSRLQFVELLPSGIGDRTLLSYEHGTRKLTALRLIEICRALGVPTPTLLNQALQRAQIHLENLVLRVNLRYVLNDSSVQFRQMHQWARNKLNEYPGGVVEVPSASVQDLATFMGCTYPELAKYLARFAPDEVSASTE